MNTTERNLMSSEEFEKYITQKPKGLKSFEAVSKYRSVNRAIKRMHVTEDGIMIPNKPFNNRGNSSTRKNKHSREMNEFKKSIYNGIKGRV